ncbi:hypothetical protein TSUD_240540 [Trifolium subterraneum]|uniref:Uncharacterized protein n=1 Tax=Trifolium subterraneum TaxID=3900 RepID=A0A2Z6NG11_TRISU|nr:hypothetical protein TSUD_240540 [Trifolium subterraneum]
MVNGGQDVGVWECVNGVEIMIVSSTKGVVKKMMDTSVLWKLMVQLRSKGITVTSCTREDKSLTRTTWYASVKTSLGIGEGYDIRDDLESLGYVLMYLLRGRRDDLESLGYVLMYLLRGRLDT